MSQSDSQMNSRRQFCQMALGLSGLALLAPKTVLAQEKRTAKPGAAPAGDLALPYVEPGKGMAQSLNYVHKHADLKKAELKTARSGVPFEQQTCQNCMIYTSAGKKDGGDVGKCTLFNGQLVKGAGWCQSWTKKG